MPKPKGYLYTVESDGRMEEHDTFQCCHCNAHFMIVKGSGKIRGFCMKCMQVTCGKLECDICVPFEKKLEAIERGG